MTIIPPEQARKIPTDRTFKRPARMVRTDKNQMEGDLHAKSRMVLPGDVDPDGEKPLEAGGIRTDAPTSSQLASHVFFLTQLDDSGGYDLLTFPPLSYTATHRHGKSIVDHLKTVSLVYIQTHCSR